jgi:FkbM family methyltransferase
MLSKLQTWIVGEFIKLNEKWIFNRRLLKFYKGVLDKKIDLVIDVGANSGQSIELFLELIPNCKIFAFEPNPVLARNLKQKFSDNPNIQSFQLGISDTAGEKIFHENVFDATSTFEELKMTSKYLKFKSMLLGVKPEEIVVKSYPVEVTTLSDFINNQCTEPIGILKIDTEGHEYACLAGLFKSQLRVEIDFIQLEIHYDDMYLNGKSLKDITEILDKNGYCLEGKVKHGFGNFEDVVFRRSDHRNPNIGS